jgi:hypothetical protein
MLDEIILIAIRKDVGHCNATLGYGKCPDLQKCGVSLPPDVDPNLVGVIVLLLSSPLPTPMSTLFISGDI